ncbi:MAG TPA: two-component regulator propeller domain-containing protein [Chitinophagaceae bacterium]|nr:two-component regulator propeller domain-containing protein [Chitinophagaceae bacterium]
MLPYFLYSPLLFCGIYAHAQLLPFTTYSVKDGLISKDVTSTIRDDKGLLWVGTPFGVNWFDGKKFFAPDMELKTGQLYVTNFYKDSDGSVFILTFYNGLYRFKNNRFTNHLPVAMLEATANNIFDMVEIDKNRYLLATDQNIFWFNGSTFSLFDSSRSDLKVQFTSIAYLADKSIVFGNNHGLFRYRFENDRWIFHSKTLQDHVINDLFSKGDDLWIATNKGLLLYKSPFPLAADPSHTYLPNKNTGNITRDSGDGIWLAVSGNICHLSDDQLTTYTPANGVPPIIKHIFCDRENIKWIATGEGLYKLYKEYYQYDKLEKAGVNGVVTRLEKDRDGHLWIGTYDGLAKKTGTGYKPYVKADGKNIGYVSWLHQGRDKKFYAGTDAGMVEIKNDMIIPRQNIQTAVMYEDDSSVFWMGTVKGRIFRYCNEKLEEVQADKLHPDFIDGIYRDKKGFLWVGYRGSGIKKYRVQHKKLIPIKEFSAATGFSDLRIRCAFPDKTGNIIFGTRTNGIFIFSTTDDGTYWHINSKNGLSANWVKSIAIDENNRLYLATNNGINILSGNYDKPVIDHLNIDDNTIPSETNFILYDDSKLWIGMTGLLLYDPAKDKKDKTAPPVYLTQLIINGQPDSSFIPYSMPTRALKLDYDQNIIAFEFAGIYLKEEVTLQYRYMLEGQDQGWSLPTDRTYVSYNLPPGHYVFKVQAKNNKGEWSARPAAFSFSIAKPFWLTSGFIVLCTLLVASLLYWLYRYRMQHALKLEKLRSRISTDLHDDIGSTLSSISILSDMTLKERDHAQSAEMVQEIKTSSISLMEKMDDIVWSINPKNDSLENLMLRIKHFASKLFEAKDIDYIIEIDALKEVKLSMEYRQHIYLILKEAINNLVKYSDGTQASIKVKYENDYLKVMVIDNGKGFDQQKPNQGNGILSMRNRARLMKAELLISSPVDNGTIVFLKVKIK